MLLDTRGQISKFVDAFEITLAFAFDLFLLIIIKCRARLFFSFNMKLIWIWKEIYVWSLEECNLGPCLGKHFSYC